MASKSAKRTTLKSQVKWILFPSFLKKRSILWLRIYNNDEKQNEAL